MAVKRFIETFVPEDYKIFLDINREAKTFSGKVAIDGLAKTETVSIHEKDLEISSVSAGGNPVSYTVNNDEDEIAISVGMTGSVSLEIAYTGKLTDNMMGIYPSYYEVDGVKKELIGTQFETHFARQAFPSVDEPEAKATFELSIKWDETPGETIISNMPEVINENGVHRFEKTVKMSSYLVAFVFGEMQAKYGKTKSGVEVGTFSTKAHPEAILDFPLQVAIDCIDFYEDYYQTPYPLAHSYHVALPDFSAGAMENWGCVTYREVCMLVDPENPTAASKQYVATVIAHELAHQWFGDLVTMRWWDDLWLNESFAENMMHLSIDALHPEWKIWEKFSSSDVNMALNRDATDGVQSVHVEVSHPDEISALFDPAIVYAKGARLMGMLRKWLGDEDFRAGLAQYFAENQYSNTVGDDLWNALSAASGKNVAEFMHSWINQPGYPVVTVKLENEKLTIRQQQFFIGEGEEKGRLWQVPLNSNVAGLPDVLADKEIVIENFKLLADKPLLLNEENAAHYIVNYEGELLDTIIANLSALTDLEKFQLLQDRRFLAKAGIISYADVIALLPHFTNETSYLVNQGLNEIFADLAVFIDEDTESEKVYQSVIEKTFVSQYQRLGWEKVLGETPDDESLRGLVLGRMTYAGNADATMKALQYFERNVEMPEKIAADIRPVVLSTKVKKTETVEQPIIVSDFINKYVATSMPEYKEELSIAVSQNKTADGLAEILSAMKNADVIKPQDLSHWYFRLIMKDFSQATAWAWLKENWTWIKEKLGGDMSFDHFVVYTSRAFKTDAQLRDYKTFFEPELENPGLKRNVLLGISNIESRITLIASQKADVLSALTDVNQTL